MFRLHIDIPLGEDENLAIALAKQLIQYIKPDQLLQENADSFLHLSNEQYIFQYRLGSDDDRQKSNYLDKNENGHVSNKKIKITLL